MSLGALHSHPLLSALLGLLRRVPLISVLLAIHGNSQSTTVNRPEVCLQLPVLLRKSAEEGQGEVEGWWVG